MKNVGILFLSLISLTTSILAAQSSLNTDSEPTPEKNVVSAADTQVHSRDPRFAVNVEGGIGFPKMTIGSLKTPLSIGPPFETFRDIKDYYENYCLDFEYLLAAGISAGVGYEFLTTEAKGTLYSYKMYIDGPST